MMDYDTDKFGNGLIDEYIELFNQIVPVPKMIVEVGVWHGGSLQWLADEFQQALITGIDIELPRGWTSHPRITLHRGDQSCSARMQQIVGELPCPPDLIIDDASHMPGPTLTTFHTLWPFLRPAGWYVIEDWIAGYWPASPYRGIQDVVLNITRDRLKYGIGRLRLVLSDPRCSLAAFRKAET